jgi:adenylate kinase family enzyme
MFLSMIAATVCGFESSDVMQLMAYKVRCSGHMQAQWVPLTGMVRKIAIKGESGSGKTTLAGELTHRLAVPHIELDALHHGPNWSEPTPEQFRALVQSVMDSHPHGWVIDGNYESKLGRLVTDAADTLVWLDLPLAVLLGRLWRRTSHRVLESVELWNGNRESWQTAFWGRDSLFAWTIRAHFRHRREWPRRFASHPGFVRLRTAPEVRNWVETQKPTVGADASLSSSSVQMGEPPPITQL